MLADEIGHAIGRPSGGGRVDGILPTRVRRPACSGATPAGPGGSTAAGSGRATCSRTSPARWRAAVRRAGRQTDFVDPALQRGLGRGAGAVRHDLAVLEHEQRRNAAYAELAGEIRVLVDVDLGDLDLALVLGPKVPPAPGRSSCRDHTTPAQKSTMTGTSGPRTSS